METKNKLLLSTIRKYYNDNANYITNLLFQNIDYEFKDDEQKIVNILKEKIGITLIKDIINNKKIVLSESTIFNIADEYGLKFDYDFFEAIPQMTIDVSNDESCMYIEIEDKKRAIICNNAIEKAVSNIKYVDYLTLYEKELNNYKDFDLYEFLENNSYVNDAINLMVELVFYNISSESSNLNTEFLKEYNIDLKKNDINIIKKLPLDILYKIRQILNYEQALEIKKNISKSDVNTIRNVKLMEIDSIKSVTLDDILKMKKQMAINLISSLKKNKSKVSTELIAERELASYLYYFVEDLKIYYCYNFTLKKNTVDIYFSTRKIMTFTDDEIKKLLKKKIDYIELFKNCKNDIQLFEKDKCNDNQLIGLNDNNLNKVICFISSFIFKNIDGEKSKLNRNFSEISNDLFLFSSSKMPTELNREFLDEFKKVFCLNLIFQYKLKRCNYINLNLGDLYELSTKCNCESLLNYKIYCYDITIYNGKIEIKVNKTVILLINISDIDNFLDESSVIDYLKIYENCKKKEKNHFGTYITVDKHKYLLCNPCLDEIKNIFYNVFFYNFEKNSFDSNIMNEFNNSNIFNKNEHIVSASILEKYYQNRDNLKSVFDKYLNEIFINIYEKSGSNNGNIILSELRTNQVMKLLSNKSYNDLCPYVSQEIIVENLYKPYVKNNEIFISNNATFINNYNCYRYTYSKFNYKLLNEEFLADQKEGNLVYLSNQDINKTLKK